MMKTTLKELKDYLKYNEEVINVTNFDDKLIKTIQKKEGGFWVVVTANDGQEAGCICQGMKTKWLYSEFIVLGSGDLFRL